MFTKKQIEQAFKDAERLTKAGIDLTSAEKNLLKYLATIR